MSMQKWFLGSLLVMFFIFGYSNAYAITIHVPEEYPTIQQGINAAANGDTVLVNDGTYNESINFLGKAITVTSVNGPEVTTIIQSGGNVITFSSGEGLASIIEKFTITGMSTAARGIYCTNSSSPTIQNNIIRGFYNSGILSSLNSFSLIKQNIISDASFGIAVSGATQVIENIVSGGFYGISCGYYINSNALIKNNTIIGNTYGIVFVMSGAVSPVIKNNIIAGNGTGISNNTYSFPIINFNNVWDNINLNYINCSPGPNDISQDPLFSEWSTTVPTEVSTIQGAIAEIPFLLGQNSPCIGAGENGVNIGAYPEQASYGVPGESIINVNHGTYLGTVSVPSYLKLIGEDAQTTIIDSNLSFASVRIWAGRQTILQNFTIRNGYRGIQCNFYSMPQIIGNIITANNLYGIECVSYSAPTIKGNTISNNGFLSMYGVGISCLSAVNEINISDNIISANQNGVYAHGANVNIANNVICDNGYGMSFYSSSTYGGGNGNVINNVISGNSQNGIQFTGTFYPGLAYALKNNIITNNSAYGVKNDISNWQDLIADYNDVWNNTSGNYGGYAQPGANDISLAPLFVNAQVGHYSLETISPCIDAGDPAILDPDNTVSNMGAYGGPEAKIANITVFTSQTQVQPGQPLQYTALLSNNFSNSPQVFIMPIVIFPDGRIHTDEVIDITLLPYQTLERQKSFTIPTNAPLGNYIFKAQVGAHETGIIDESIFNFTVIEPGLPNYPVYNSIPGKPDLIAVWE